MKENDCLDSKHEPARFLSPNRGKEQIGHANCPFWQHVMGAKSQKLDFEGVQTATARLPQSSGEAA
jgi:hypothetical protein